MSLKGQGGEEWRNFEEKAQHGDAGAWRGLAEGTDAAIAGKRQREVRWRLVDRAGQPLRHQNCTVEQTGSAFDWGFNSWGWMVAQQEGRFDHWRERHQRELRLELFNTIILLHYWAEATPSDAPISEEYQGEIDYEQVDRLLNWARGHGLRCKGHPLFWQVPKALPKWLQKYDEATRWKFVEVRIRQICSRFRGRMARYDLSNEMLWEPLLGHTADRHWPHVEPVEAIADDHARLMGWAREEDPDALYLLNEYGLVAGDTEPLPVPDQLGRPVTRDEQARRMVALAEAMRERGQAPDALGLQTAPGEWERLGAFRDTLDLLGSTGLPVHVTEFRANLKPLETSGLEGREREEFLADYLETVLRLCYAHPSCEGFYLWDTGILANGRKRTAVWERFHELLQERWRTRWSGSTDEDGRMVFRGFHGDYRVRLPRARGSSGYAMELRVGNGPDEQELVVDY